MLRDLHDFQSAKFNKPESNGGLIAYYEIVLALYEIKTIIALL